MKLGGFCYFINQTPNLNIFRDLISNLVNIIQRRICIQFQLLNTERANVLNASEIDTYFKPVEKPKDEALSVKTEFVGNFKVPQVREMSHVHEKINKLSVDLFQKIEAQIILPEHP